jgi:hypothetical protein
VILGVEENMNMKQVAKVGGQNGGLEFGI